MKESGLFTEEGNMIVVKGGSYSFFFLWSE
jgi:hypothetical protein